MVENNSFPIVAKTLEGLENILAEEITNLGGQDVTIGKRVVYFRGNTSILYKVNYWSRFAISILKPIAAFDANSDTELYDEVLKIDWNDIFEINKTFMVNAVVSNSNITHSQYASLRTKDAIVDQFRSRFNDRPNIDTKEPEIRIHVYISSNKCEISLDSSGSPLFKRGYRRSDHQAPLNEVLAAAMIKLSGWNYDCNFIDPMCGSGTLLIEAAMAATNLPGGYYRHDFAFLHWRDFDETIWKSIVKESLSQQVEFDYRIIGSDISAKNIELAQGNIKYARLHHDIELQISDILDFVPPQNEKGIIVMNPPYGERLTVDDLSLFYSQIGTALKHHFKGYTAWIISSDMRALKLIGLHPTAKIPLLNGSLECKFQKFELYDGSKKRNS